MADRRSKSFDRGGLAGRHGRIETVAAAEVANPGDPLRDVVGDRGIAGLGTFNATTGWSGSLAAGDTAFWLSVFATSVCWVWAPARQSWAFAGWLICGSGFWLSTTSGWAGGGAVIFSAAGGAAAVVSGIGAGF